jgi:hypothetical protein
VEPAARVEASHHAREIEKDRIQAVATGQKEIIEIHESIWVSML